MCIRISLAKMLDISFTPQAEQRLKEVAEAEQIDFAVTFLRIKVVSGGCSGLTYDLGWDSVEQSTDEREEIAGIPVAMDLNSRLYMEGSELHFSDGLEGKGFHFNNPQAARNCACGESFAV